jgi:hypothetical protein
MFLIRTIDRNFQYNIINMQLVRFGMGVIFFDRLMH